MHSGTMPPVNLLALLASTIAIFVLGGLWYSPLLFAKKWMALQGKTPEQIAASGGSVSAMMYVQALLCGLLTSAAMLVVTTHLPDRNAIHGAIMGVICWLGFAGATSYGTALFSMKSKALWWIDSGYNLVCFVISGVILTAWQ